MQTSFDRVAVLSACVVFIHLYFLFIKNGIRFFHLTSDMTSVFKIQYAVRIIEVYSRLAAKGMDLVGNIGVEMIVEAVWYHSFQSFHPEIFSAF